MEEYEVINLTNISEEDFTGMYGGKEETIKAGQTKPYPRFLAEHFAKQLVDKILIKKEETWTDELLRKPYLDKVLGQIAVPVETAPAVPAPAETPTQTEPEKEFAELKEKEPAQPVSKKFKCERCGKTFKVRVALAGHQRGCKK